jgi:hypothetical protein
MELGFVIRIAGVVGAVSGLLFWHITRVGAHEAVRPDDGVRRSRP